MGWLPTDCCLFSCLGVFMRDDTLWESEVMDEAQLDIGL